MSSYGPLTVAASSSTRIRFVVPVAISAGDHSQVVGVEEEFMLAESHDDEQIIARVAALDIAKAELVCCVRVPASAGGKRRLQEVTTYSTMTQSLTELANRLVEMGVQRVVMEATSSYWKPVFYLLEAHGLDPWLVNARDVKHLPGRPKTDVLDAVWLCKLEIFSRPVDGVISGDLRCG